MVTQGMKSEVMVAVVKGIKIGAIVDLAMATVIQWMNCTVMVEMVLVGVVCEA